MKMDLKCHVFLVSGCPVVDKCILYQVIVSVGVSTS